MQYQTTKEPLKALIFSCLLLTLLTGCLAKDSEIHTHTEICPEVDIRLQSPSDDTEIGENQAPKKPRIPNPIKVIQKLFLPVSTPSEDPVSQHQSDGLEAARAAPRTVNYGKPDYQTRNYYGCISSL